MQEVCLSLEEIAFGQNCDTDKDEGEYNETQQEVIAFLQESRIPPPPKKTLKELIAERKKEIRSKQADDGTEGDTEEEEEAEQEKEEEDEEADEDDDDDDTDKKEYRLNKLYEKVIFDLQLQYRFQKRICLGAYIVTPIQQTQQQQEQQQEPQLYCLKIQARKRRHRMRLPIELRILSHIRSFKSPKHVQVMKSYLLKEDVYAFLSPYAMDLLHVKDIHTHPKQIQLLMHQLLCGLRQLHRHGIIHRDIKHSNVLWDGKTATIIDYDKATWVTTKGHHILVGTDGFIAPEVWRHERDGTHHPKPYSTKCDMYSLGVLFGCLLFGVTEYEVKEIHASIFRQHVKTFFDAATAGLLRGLLRRKPRHRFHASLALKSDYFIGII